MLMSSSIRWRAVLALLAATVLASACGTVDLGPRYSPPPIRLPEPLPASPASAPPAVQPMPVPPPQSVPQPLPPIGTPVPAPPAASPSANPNLVTLTTQLDGASVIPPARSGATGQLDALYDGATRMLRWKASWNGLAGAITAVQFRGPADATQIAQPVLLWPGPFGDRYEGRATLTPSQATDMLSGLWYVSVFTSSYPQGELRGQLRVVN